jgi:dipeptide/tripeptide permease
MLSLFLKNELKFSPSHAKAIYSGFTSVAYFAPLLGSIMGDAILGRFLTIAIFALIYILGSLILVYSAANTDQHITIWIALLLIALSTGFLKPNISTFGAQTLKTENKQAISAYFSMFYFSVNFGSVISTLTLPILQRHKGYAVAFSLPAAALFIAWIIFVLGKRSYVHVKPTQSLYVRMFKIVFASFREKSYISENIVVKNTQNNEVDDLNDLGTRGGIYHIENAGELAGNGNYNQPGYNQNTPNDPNSPTDETHVSISNPSDDEDKQKIAINRVLSSTRSRKLKQYLPEQDKSTNFRSPDPFEPLSSTSLTSSPSFLLSYTRHWLDYAKLTYKSEHIEEIKQILTLLPILPFMVFFWLNYDQQSSSFPFQAEKMDRIIKFGPSWSVEVQPSQVNALNAVCILLFVPFFDVLCYPFLRNVFKLPLYHLNRMVVGMCFTVLAFLSCSWVDYQIYNSPPHTVSILYQIPQYVLVTIAEVLISISGLEYIYLHSPAPFRSTMAGFWGVTVAVGDLIAVVMFATIGEKWTTYRLSLFCAGLMFLDMIVFFIFKCWYHYKLGDEKLNRNGDETVVEEEEEEEEEENGNVKNDEANINTTDQNDGEDIGITPHSQLDDNGNDEYQEYNPIAPFLPHDSDYRQALIQSMLNPK